VPIRFADLMPCPFNLFHAPHSWFDLFLSAETETPPADLMEEWKVERERLEAMLTVKLPRDLVRRPR
jgi:hypothetical protein